VFISYDPLRDDNGRGCPLLIYCAFGDMGYHRSVILSSRQHADWLDHGNNSADIRGCIQILRTESITK
jgi:hypothetical protein